ncbi:MAG: TraR/DksA family transcriptional regulator [Gammaproteobacteria bacterium]|nr:TraR/DksA family transcriptional regulator [Gammaproteobacteria bacterium]
MNEIDLQKFKHMLEKKRDVLMSAQELAKSSIKTVNLDQSSVGRVSRADALQAQSMAIEATRLRQQQLRQVSTALALVASGDYGYCSVCDSEIDPRRLEIEPASTLCVPCASKVK